MKRSLSQENNKLRPISLLKRGFFVLLLPMFLIGSLFTLFFPTFHDIPEDLPQIKTETVRILNDVGFNITTDLKLKSHSKDMFTKNPEGETKFLSDGTKIAVKWKLNDSKIVVTEIKNVSQKEILYTTQ
ncbi:hypothetical protein [Spirochaeta cellobiosiphila]|uniref:hypothetical protein n=1 Tax=Spirochaeta cellobiosiphila TaxID=504483 RepID=UPI00042271C4|nr:hypothetical protein [Spirochaeta cellobiosiphila]